MYTLKIKKIFTFWFRSYQVTNFKDGVKTITGELGFYRPTIALRLINGDYLYIDLSRVKEVKYCTDTAQKEVNHGNEICRRVGETPAE